ncbi:BT_3928 family protein [Arundinibacter roseus]|uniref:DoxX family membrane protein n=1 Tax=Arundinibacter roseus TaxID=2070510 RepID=A0A4R4K9T7_9BACT|nr:BT_3928 family protein [Arundinibacter roseus]TDB64528.1 DoxX family membrane protein [Arundinibacter roseus]
MKLAAQIAKVVVGVIFIFSGLIKLNDPVGTEIKLEEYFEVFAQDLPALHDLFMALIPLSLYLSVILCTAEVVLGIALLLGYKPKTTSWLLLGIILFFTFLTFYSAYFNKVTDCGCFGDAIKLKPWTSFGKDIFLLILILLILYKRKEFTAQTTGMLVALATVVSLGIAFYAIRHLPILDLLPYREGASIPDQMQPSEPIRYSYIFEKEGKEVQFESFPTDTTLKFKEMIILNEEAKPKITDYRTWNDEGDFTQESFKGSKLFVIVKNLKDINTAALPEIRQLLTDLKGSAVETLILTSASGEEIEKFRTEQQLKIPFYYADATVLKTISRSNPGIWLLKEGVVKGKWHFNDTPKAKEVLEKLSR